MAIVVKNLSFNYGSINVLKNLSFTVEKGKFTVILGKNGCGKSTLLKLLSGLLPCRPGQVSIWGNDIAELKISERAKLIGYLPQAHDPIFPFTVQDVVLTGRASYVFTTPSRFDKEKAERAISQVGISHLKHRPYTELSGGERQLVLIARLLAQEPKIIMLDEPLTFLDLQNQLRLMALIRDLVKTGLTVLAVLHDPNIAFIHADDFILLKAGEIIEMTEDNSPWDALTLRKLYDYDIKVIPFRDRALVTPI